MICNVYGYCLSNDVINSDVHREVSIAYGSSSSGNMVELYTIKKNTSILK